MNLLLLTLLGFVALAYSQFDDPRCPVPNGIGTCGMCGLCSQGQICCKNGCGTSCMPIPTGPKDVCPVDRPFNYCMVDPCLNAQCPEYPSATCTADRCGGCHANFTFQGRSLTEADCNPPPPRCPPLVDPAALVTFAYDCTLKQDVGSVCTLSCPKGQVLNGVGLKVVTCQADQQWSLDVSNARCDALVSGCPPDEPLVYCFVPPCLFATCPAFPQARCVATQCGSCSHDFYLGDLKLTKAQCIVEDPPRCPPLVDPAALVTFAYDCTLKQDVGSVCTLSCPKGQVLHGVGLKVVTCQADQQWSLDVSNARCGAPISVCPPDKPLFYCIIPPCHGAKCPAFPQAKCVSDQCGGCNFDFYLGDTKLTREQCIPEVPSQCSYTCKYAVCPRFRSAICKMDCRCRRRFYNPTTLEQVNCYF